MGRIGEALRRAGTAKPSRLSSTPQDQDRTFASPWAFNDPERSVTPIESAPERRKPVDPPASFEEPVLRRTLRQGVTDRFQADWKTRLAVGADTDPVLSEQFRRLAATLIHNQRTDQLKVILITSAVPGEGKTLTSVNLSLILSESYRRRVLLVDADLRRPSIGTVANLGNGDGLSESIAGEERKASLVQLSETLTLLPAGRPQGDPLGGISSPRMSRLLEEASARFDWVIVDTPPLEAAADASLLAELVDAVVLVVRANRTPQAAIQRAIDAVGRERILGVVLNGVEGAEVISYDGQYGYSAVDADLEKE
jgi:capsular exopolysaccharide synthesis family protein